MMPRLLQPLWLLLASTADAKLAPVVEYLKAENRILRAKITGPVPVTPRERERLVKLGSALGAALASVIGIVSYRTFRRWVTGTPAGAVTKKAPSRKPGRPRTETDIRELILTLARESGWGYTRVLGELKKLGIHTVSRTTVANILRAAGLDPGPKRGEGSWSEFVRRHAATLWAGDFVSVRTHTLGGVVDVYLLFFIHVGSREVLVSAPTASPDAAWVAQQARNASMAMAEQGAGTTHLLIDHDAKYAANFDTVFEAQDVEVKRVGPRAPNMNAFAERWVQTLRRECLDHFLILGERHLDHLVREFVAHYNEKRPHQSRGNVPLPEADETDPRSLTFPAGEVRCRERLGGLLKHYSRAA
ncbi:MAG TPA: integrase core domain-containing protein [Gemmata sp.]